MGWEDTLASAASAAMPQPGQGGGNMTTFGPAPLVQPPPPVRFQTPQLQKPQAGNEFSTSSGNKRATKQAAFSAIANMVKAGGDYVTAKKTRTLQMNIERLMEAQRGLQEAQAALQSNPQDPKAKAAVEQNTAIVNDITKDPKINKQLQKAFNIDLFGEGKNKQENQALIAAWKAFDEKQQKGDKTALNPVAQRLMQGQPMRQQINPQAQQQAQAIKLGLIPNANTIMKNTTEILKMQSQAKTAEERNEATIKASENLAEARKYGADKAVEAAYTRAFGQQETARIVAQSRDHSATLNAQTWDKRLAAMKDIAGMKTTNPVFKQLYESAGVYTKELKQLADQNKSLQTELDKKVKLGGLLGTIGMTKSNMSDADANIARMTQQTNRMKMLQLQQQLDDTEKKMKVMTNLGMLNIGGGNSQDQQEEDIVVPAEEVPQE